MKRECGYDARHSPVFCFMLAALLITAAACQTRLQTSSALPHLERAIINKDDIIQAIAIEEQLGQSSGQFAPEGTSWFVVREGESKLILTASHATRSIRNGQLREFADVGTGSLAEMLHRLVGVTVLYTTFASPSDPNHYDDNEFKRQLKRQIADKRPVLVMDLHTSHYYRPYDLDIGTMDGESIEEQERLLGRLVEILDAEGLRNFSLNYFPASKSETVTKFVASLGIPCVQLEFSSTWMSPARSDLHAHRYAQLLQGLLRFVKEVDGGLKDASEIDEAAGSALRQ